MIYVVISFDTDLHEIFATLEVLKYGSTYFYFLLPLLYFLVSLFTSSLVPYSLISSFECRFFGKNAKLRPKWIAFSIWIRLSTFTHLISLLCLGTSPKIKILRSTIYSKKCLGQRPRVEILLPEEHMAFSIHVQPAWLRSLGFPQGPMRLFIVKYILDTNFKIKLLQ